MGYFEEIRKYVGTKPLILPGSVVIVVNEKNEILLQKRPDETWGLPGGLMDLGESMEETAFREVKEETGITIKNLQLLGLFSGNDYYFKLKNGDELYSVTAVYLSKDFEGIPLADKIESLDLCFFSIDNLPTNLTDEYRGYIEPYKAIIIR